MLYVPFLCGDVRMLHDDPCDDVSHWFNRDFGAGGLTPSLGPVVP